MPLMPRLPVSLKRPSGITSASYACSIWGSSHVVAHLYTLSSSIFCSSVKVKSNAITNYLPFLKFGPKT